MFLHYIFIIDFNHLPSLLLCGCCWPQLVHPYEYFYRILFTTTAAISASIWWNYCFSDESLGNCHFHQIIVHYRTVPQFCRLVQHFHDFLSSAHTTFTVQSVRSVGSGMLIEQISCGADFMPIGPQENVSLIFEIFKGFLWSTVLRWITPLTREVSKFTQAYHINL